MCEPTLSSATGYVMPPDSAEVSSTSPGYVIHKLSELEVKNLRDSDLVYVEKRGCRWTFFSRDIFDLFCAFPTALSPNLRSECRLHGLTTDVLIPQNVRPSCMCFKHLVDEIVLPHHAYTPPFPRFPLQVESFPCSWCRILLMVSTWLFPLLVHLEQLQRLFLGFQVVVSTSVSHFIHDPKHT